MRKGRNFAIKVSREDAVTATGAGLLRVACNVCGASEERLIAVQNSYRVVRCAGCGFVYVNPRPDEATLAGLYLSYLPDKMEDPESWRGYMKTVFSNAASEIARLSPKGGRTLDIGCGYGFFLDEMKQKGFAVSGMDVSPTAVGYAAKRGFDVRLGTLDTVAFEEGAFDVVTMFYVLEHIPDPLKALQQVKRILKPGGLLLLRLPHTTPIVKALSVLGINNNLYDPPFHLNDFSASSIKTLLSKAGYAGPHTFIGGVTRPPEFLKRAITLVFGLVAEALYMLSFGRIAMPGVAKNTIAYKPPIPS